MTAQDSKLFKQIFRFIVVGVINTAIDLIVLNVLIAITQQGKSGVLYSIFKGISFLVALTNSYLMNKHWTFAGQGTNNRAIEVSEFVIVSVIGFIINVVVASVVVNSIHPLVGVEKYWPSFGALCGTAVGLIWNFLGY